jgi:HAD superfamily hydrolase (TIGR01450 family)
MINTSFLEAITDYKVIFFDSYGVLRNYDGLVPGIANTFEALRAADKAFYVITNDASRSPELLARGFCRQGLEAIDAERIVSSGMLAKDFLDLKVKTGIVAYLGTDESAHYIEHPGLDAWPLHTLHEHQFAKVNALVLLDDEGFDWCTGLNKAVNLMRRRTIPVILANADGAYPVNNHDVGIAIGGLGWMLEKIVGKKLIRFGKPDSQIFMYAYEQVLAELPDVSKKDILMVGDTLQTDILGGNKFGLDTALVLTGNTLPDDAETRIASSGIAPTFICASAAV